MLIDNSELKSFDRSQATNIDDIVIDETKEPEERIRDYLEQVQNPYFLMVGRVLVQMSYADTPYTFNDRYKSIVMNRAD